MRAEANYDLMRDIDERYRRASNLSSRDFYSVFYGPLRKSKFLMLNANPGGSPTSYKIVNVLDGEHEYIEGRNSGPTTRNGAEMLMHLAGTSDPEDIRGVQVLNRFFRRSPGVQKGTERSSMEEARPFLAELIQFIAPEALLFGGDKGVQAFADIHGAELRPLSAPIKGPNGSSDAVYFCEYEMVIPYYGDVAAIGVYHPSKMNRVFREQVFPVLRDRLGPLMPGLEAG